MSSSDPTSDGPTRVPPEAWAPLLRLAQLASRPIDRFLHVEAASGILLLVAAAAALIWANSAWGASYAALWHTPVGLQVGSFHFERSLEWVVNDGLMVIFFFVVGLEIRREIHLGELSEWRRAALPAAAALGGMVAPALLYLGIAGGAQTRSGWGVPMATDIAFAVGVLTLLGKRVPPALRVLLLALAVIDDLGAIVVIALFYSAGISGTGLLAAGLGIGAIFALQAIGVRNKLAYVVPSLVVWAGTYAAGIHPTIAGVVIGLITPVRAWLGPEGFIERAQGELGRLSGAGSKALAEVRRQIAEARREAVSPAESLIESLHSWVAFFIMPVFALANAGVVMGELSLEGASSKVAVAVAVGLVLGKPVGVALASFLTLRLGVATLPLGLGARHVLVLGVAAGIGFTMAIFIAQLAFVDPKLLGAAKLGVLVASGAAAVLGLVLGRVLLPASAPEGTAASAHEAEGSTVA